MKKDQADEFEQELLQPLQRLSARLLVMQGRCTSTMSRT